MQETWLRHVLRYSRRDQLSVNLALQRAGLLPHVRDFDNAASDYHSWPHPLGHDRSGIRRPSISLGPPEARLRAAEQALAEQVAVSDALLTSRSWRLLAPARRLGHAVRQAANSMQLGIGVQAALRTRLGVHSEHEGFPIESWYIYFRIVRRIRRRSRGRRWLLVGPDELRRPYLLWKGAQVLGLDIVTTASHPAPSRSDSTTSPGQASSRRPPSGSSTAGTIL
jgi:hypothetical protein